MNRRDLFKAAAIMVFGAAITATEQPRVWYGKYFVYAGYSLAKLRTPIAGTSTKLLSKLIGQRCGEHSRFQGFETDGKWLTLTFRQSSQYGPPGFADLQSVAEHV